MLIPRQPLGVEGWRWVVFFPVVGALLVWWIRRAIPESPRWLAGRGRLDEAEAVLAAMEARVAREFGRALPAPEAPDPAAIRVKAGQGRFGDLFRPPYRNRAILLALFNFFQTIGFYGFGNWVPKLVAAQGVSVTSSLLYSALIALAFPVGPLLFSLFADRFELKWQAVAAALGTASFGLMFTLVRAPVAIIALGIAITLSNNLLSFSYHAYQAELFPTRIRARAIGFVYSFSRLSTIFTSFVIGYLSAHAGNPGVFTFIAVSMAVAAAAIGACPPTRGRSLEQLGAPDARSP
jgi:putative MFS transporter